MDEFELDRAVEIMSNAIAIINGTISHLNSIKSDSKGKFNVPYYSFTSGSREVMYSSKYQKAKFNYVLEIANELNVLKPQAESALADSMMKPELNDIYRNYIMDTYTKLDRIISELNSVKATYFKYFELKAKVIDDANIAAALKAKNIKAVIPKVQSVPTDKIELVESNVTRAGNTAAKQVVDKEVKVIEKKIANKTEFMKQMDKQKDSADSARVKRFKKRKEVLAKRAETKVPKDATPEVKEKAEALLKQTQKDIDDFDKKAKIEMDKLDSKHKAELSKVNHELAKLKKAEKEVKSIPQKIKAVIDKILATFRKLININKDGTETFKGVLVSTALVAAGYSIVFGIMKTMKGITLKAFYNVKDAVQNMIRIILSPSEYGYVRSVIITAIVTFMLAGIMGIIDNVVRLIKGKFKAKG